MKDGLLKKPIISSLLFFAIAAGLGLSMRSAFVFNMPAWFEYRNIQHAHSHIALLGWLFGIFYICIVHAFGLDQKKYIRLFWLLQGTVVGMFLTFPFFGYASLSIVFLTLHILLSYLFAFKVWKDVDEVNQGVLPKLFLKTSLFFLVLSTFGTWVLGPMVANGMKGTALYYAAIQFYLHFLFNGWFIFGLLAILFAFLSTKDRLFNIQKGKQFYWVLLVGTILTYALAVSWSTPHIAIFLTNSIGVTLQLLAIFLFIRLIKRSGVSLEKRYSSYTIRVVSLAIIALILKIVVQSLVVLPVLAEVSYTIRNFVVGFIHLLLLGTLTLFSFGIIAHLLKRPLHGFGTWVFIIGVFITEALLFVQGIMLWQGWGFMPYYSLLMVIGSAVMFLGILIILIDVIKSKQQLV